jgi:hypothetical protein
VARRQIYLTLTPGSQHLSKLLISGKINRSATTTMQDRVQQGYRLGPSGVGLQWQ